MNTAAQITTPQAISVTNFDLSSLYLLRPEIKVTLENAEKHLSEFNDDIEQAPLLLDSITMLKQLANVLKLISLTGASDLAEVLASSMQHLYDDGDNHNTKLILAISQGVMTLSRYIEFVLLQETLEPSLLYPIINQLKTATNQPVIQLSDIVPNDFTYITLANPARNFKALHSLDLQADILATAYRTGLSVALAANSSHITDSDLQKLSAMHQACHIIANKSDALFWRAAEAATKDLHKLLPLNEKQKRIFIFLDQQFHNYLPADDSRFADLVSFACLQDNELATQIKNELRNNQLDESQLSQFKRFMFGPDQKIATTLNALIQQEIDDIKSQVDALVNHTLTDIDTVQNPPDLDFTAICDKLDALSSTFTLLSLSDSAKILKNCRDNVASWKHPKLEDLDQLLNDLIIAENAAISMSKSHTPGAQAWQLHNEKISIYQLDTAYLELMQQTRHLIRRFERNVGDYMDGFIRTAADKDADKDIRHEEDISNDIPANLGLIAGALRFLDLTDSATIIKRLSTYAEKEFVYDEEHQILKDERSYTQFAKVAEILLAIDHQLSARQKQHPISKHATYVGNTSLYKLLEIA